VPISVVFRPRDYTVEKHYQVLAKLREIGQGAPAGRVHHQALARDGAIETVVDVWESPAELQAFAAHLMPILAEVGVTAPEPELYDAVLLD